MKTEVVSKLETCEQETGWADLYFDRNFEKGTLLPTHLILKRISRIIDQSQPGARARLVRRLEACIVATWRSGSWRFAAGCTGSSSLVSVDVPAGRAGSEGVGGHTNEV